MKQNLLSSLCQLKTALVYDRVNTAYGGAEQVIIALKQLFPDAPLFTSVFDPKQACWAQDFTVIPSFINCLPVAKQHHRWFLPLMPLAFESLNLAQYDLIISVTSAEAKGVITLPHQLHVSYLLTPPRYLYQSQADYFQHQQLLALPVIKQIAKGLLKYVQWWDQAAVYRPDVIIPLSHLVKQRVKKIYNLTTTEPIYPPIDVIQLQQAHQALKTLNLPEKYLLVVSRLVPYKKIELAIKAAVNLKLNLVIVGDGPVKKQLQQLAQQHLNQASSQAQIVFLPAQPQPIVNSLMAQAQLFLAPGIDDFGISPLQANLFGTPAIINSHSGVAEVFQTGVQGEVIDDFSIDTLCQTIQKTLSTTYNSAKMKKCAAQYNTQKFLLEFAKMLQPLLFNQS